MVSVKMETCHTGRILQQKQDKENGCIVSRFLNVDGVGAV